MARATPSVDHTRTVRNQSSRHGVHPSLIVVHTTEGHNRPGLTDLRGLGGWFDNPAADASSHVADDAEGNSARYVDDANKAWTCAAFNPVSLNIEQIGFAADSRASWFRRREQLRETARWIALWSKRHGIPIRKGKVRGRVVVRAGVVRHSALGAAGGGHHDPGAGYPLSYVLLKARQYRRRL